MKKYIETECYIVASATDKRKDSLKEYMKKIKDMGIDIVTVREQNKQNKENEDE
jgi:thiamine monophosphate synthase